MPIPPPTTRSTTARRELRILVTGASTVTWASPMSGPRADEAFPRVLERTLREQGHHVDVRNVALLASPTKDLFTRWEEQVLQWSPDVIITIPGHYETIHALLPHWFERYANRVDRRPGPVRTGWRRRVVRPAWRALATAQAKLDARLPAALGRRRMRRVLRDVDGYARLCQQVASPAHLFVEVLPPAGVPRGWFPGMEQRIDLLNRGVEELVSALGLPHVQVVSISDLADGLYGDDRLAATPDGFHFTPDLHRTIGHELARRILELDQPHERGV